MQEKAELIWIGAFDIVQGEVIQGEVIQESPKYTGGYITFEGEAEQALYREWLREMTGRGSAGRRLLPGGGAS